MTAKLVGGLGNQLFTFAAAKALSERIGVHLVLDASGVGPGKTNHGVDIERYLPQDGTVSIVRHSSTVVNLARRVFLGLIHSNVTCPSRFRRKYFRSNRLGYDAGIMNLKPPVYVEGYFQSYRYFKMLRCPHSLISLNPTESSSWFKETKAQLVLKRPLVMHIRRGDYLLEAEKFGCLSLDYYKNALEALPDKFQQGEVWVFSDSPELLGHLSQISNGHTFKLVAPPSDSHPMESLALMSLADAIIIGNSTFSFWAAQLSLSAEVIVAPAKWFKGIPDPEDLIPTGWVRVQSCWEATVAT